MHHPQTKPPTPTLPARRGRRTFGLLAAALLVVAPVLLTGCGGESTYEIQEVRHTRSASPAPAQSSVQWVFDLPEGWTELPARPQTLLVFSVAGRDDAICTFSILGGSGGGLTANVNRWRRQMSLEPIADEAVAALPKRTPFLTFDAVEVDLEGTYVGMGGRPPLENAGLLGWILTKGQDAAFLKLTGPRDVVVAERERFQALGSSLKLIRKAASPIPESGELPAGHPPIEPAMPEGHPPVEPALPDGHPPMGTGPTAPAGPVAPSSLTWKAPEGWVKQPARMMREVTFRPDGAQKAECYVSLAMGTLDANLNRWRGQYGEAALSAEEIAKLERIPMLGGEGVLVEIASSPESMLGVVFERPGSSVFVKMKGPKEEVLPELENFKAFCRSLSE